jgi:Mn2+/Fe2+ NRAMP family transporter
LPRLSRTATGVGESTSKVIVLAQVATGLLLPIVAIFLLYVMNNQELLNRRMNSTWQNVVGGIATLFVIVLGIRSLLGIAGIL